VGTYIISDLVERQSRDETKHIITKDVVGLFLGEVVSIQKKHIVEKDVVGLLLEEVVSTKKTHILAKDVVGLLVRDNEDLLIVRQN
jgi:hypothetical protein